MPDICPWKKLIFGESHLWYLVTLFCIFFPFVFYDGWKQTSKKSDILIYTMLLAMYLTGNWLNQVWGSGYYSIRMIFSLYVYFGMGIFVVKYNILNNPKLKSSQFLLMGLLCFTCVFLLGKRLLFLTPIFISVTVIALLSLCGRITFWKGYNASILKKVVGLVDINSMGIYIIHHFFIWLAIRNNSICNFLDNNIYQGPILIFMVSLACSLIITILIRKNKYGRFLLGEKFN